MPSQRFPSLFYQWRDAANAATNAETALFNASVEYVSGTRPAPSEADWERARQLRARATELFQLALEQVAAVSDHAKLLAEHAVWSNTSAASAEDFQLTPVSPREAEPHRTIGG